MEWSERKCTPGSYLPWITQEKLDRIRAETGKTTGNIKIWVMNLWWQMISQARWYKSLLIRKEREYKVKGRQEKKKKKTKKIEVEVNEWAIPHFIKPFGSLKIYDFTNVYLYVTLL